MRSILACLACVAVLSSIGCGGGGNAFAPNEGFAEKLTAKANKLAQSELQRLREAELVYKDVLRFDGFMQHPNPGSGVYYKGYREYTDYTVRDILRRDSYLKPIAYEIGFNFRFMATERHHTDYPDSPSKAAAGKDFKPQPKSSSPLVHVYECDPDGKFVGASDWLPPRETAYTIEVPEPLSAPPAVPHRDAKTAAPNRAQGVPLPTRKLTPEEVRELRKNQVR